MEDIEYCPEECSFLTPTEREQNEENHKSVHFCRKHEILLRHGRIHPLLMAKKSCEHALSMPFLDYIQIVNERFKN